MKRSEMINKIAELLIVFNPSAISPYGAANALLFEIEEAGMRPPKYNKPIEEVSHKDLSFEYKRPAYELPVNEWEPENDE